MCGSQSVCVSGLFYQCTDGRVGDCGCELTLAFALAFGGVTEVLGGGVASGVGGRDWLEADEDERATDGADDCDWGWLGDG